jgi:hypothetical protein
VLDAASQTPLTDWFAYAGVVGTGGAVLGAVAGLIAGLAIRPIVSAERWLLGRVNASYEPPRLETFVTIGGSATAGLVLLIWLMEYLGLH